MEMVMHIATYGYPYVLAIHFTNLGWGLGNFPALVTGNKRETKIRANRVLVLVFCLLVA